MDKQHQAAPWSMGQMQPLSRYQLSVTEALISAKVEVLVIGGMAMQAHGMNRETKDFDLFVSRDRLNAEKLQIALAELVANVSSTLTVETLQMVKKLICLPDPATKEVDILTSIGALDFGLAMQNCFLAKFGSIELPVLGLEELLYSKVVSAAGNHSPEAQARDVADTEAILAFWKQRLNSNVEAAKATSS